MASCLPSDLPAALIRKCCSLSFKAHKSDSPYILDTSVNSHSIFAFPGSWSTADWFSDEQFGDLKLRHDHCNSLKVLGTDQAATANDAFSAKFFRIFPSSRLDNKITKILSATGLCGFSCYPTKVDVTIRKRIVFTGHSSGGAIAILATIWFLERRKTPAPLCITFGSPLVGDTILGHAIRRESWSSSFVNIVLPRDLVPRILLSPLCEIHDDLEALLRLWSRGRYEPNLKSNQSFGNFFDHIMNNTFSTASYDSCVLRSTTGGSSLLQAVNGVVQLSPYRPFGSFLFCCGDGRMVKVENHDIVLQILFYSMKCNVGESADSNMDEHMRYVERVQKCLKTNYVVDLDQNLGNAPLISFGDGSGIGDLISVFQELGLTMEARLSLAAAKEVQNMKLNNLETVKGYKKQINGCLLKLEKYRCICEAKGLGYYDSFKSHKNTEDFEANADRLELVGFWEVVREMLKVFELPDSFEVDPDWVNLGTEIRLLVEPIDIANYYRHDRTNQAGLYDITSDVRPKYYKYPEKWLEHEKLKLAGQEDLLYQWRGRLTLVSCFWARVENLSISLKSKPFEEVEGDVSKFRDDVIGWLDRGDLSKDVLLEGSTFMKLWTQLPEEHPVRIQILGRIEAERNRIRRQPAASSA